MDIENIKAQIQPITDTSSIYLLEALTKAAGFFATDGKLLYIAKDIYEYTYEGIETDYLKLQTHVRISSVKNNQTFSDDYYNIIIKEIWMIRIFRLLSNYVPYTPIILTI